MKTQYFNSKLRQSILSLVGTSVGNIKAIDIVPISETQKQTFLLCECICGNTIKMSPHDFRTNHYKSCGCMKYAKRTKRIKRIYDIWIMMNSRCYNSSNNAYKYYGGRGITICDEWKDYMSFQNWALSNGYDDSLTIDRIDPNKSYSPDNCRWSDWNTQSNNKRNSRRITFNGVTHNAIEWSKILGISDQTIYNRLNNGWSVERALTEPVSNNRHFSRNKKVLQLDINNNVVNTYNNWNEIPKEYNHSSISRVINGQRKTYKGFYWVLSS